jgi:radical SAM protein with 4Fe4S-binding SPASM domain
VVDPCVPFACQRNHTLPSLSGGEPFLYPHFSELLDFLTTSRFRVVIYSSGVILGYKDTLASIPLSALEEVANRDRSAAVFLNIQGHNEHVVERINRTPGSYSLIRKSAESILKAGLYLGAHVVPFEANYTYLQQIFQSCSQGSFDEVRFLRFVPQGRGSDATLSITPTQFAEVDLCLRNIMKGARDGARTKVSLGHPIDFLFLTDSESLYPQKCRYCRGGSDAPLILPNGDVSICPAWKDLPEYYAGNIYRSDFEQIWESEYFLKLRAFVSHGYTRLCDPCGNCFHLETCRGKCVAQRLLASKNTGQRGGFDQLILHSPDPQCFRGTPS